MNIVPDYIEPLTAYRVWQWCGFGVRSLNGSQWFPGEPFNAECDAEFFTAFLQTLTPHNGDIPGDFCTCGVYAAKNLEHLINIGYEPYGIHGEVSLWGKVVVAKLGYRAQCAYPKNFIVPVHHVPNAASAMESRMETLTVYGVPISVAFSESTMPFWSRESGYYQECIDRLVSRAVEKPCLRVIKTGDRVSIRNVGVGIYLKKVADDRGIDAIIKTWGKVVSIPHDSIKWDETNYRWESNSPSHTFVRQIAKGASNA